jgi:hypothetical protein
VPTRRGSRKLHGSDARNRIGGHKLSRGSYRLSGVATDPAKNASVPKRKGYRIVR